MILKRHGKRNKFYIKITIYLKKEMIVLGGEYHADAEKILIENYNSFSKDIWGGGYNIYTKSFEVNAMINLRPKVNSSLEIIDPKIRKRYIELVTEKLKRIEEFI